MTITRRTFERQRVWPTVLARIGPGSALEVLDLSEGGAGVLSTEPLVRGETIRLQFPLPNRAATANASRLAEVAGETVWSAKTGRAGIRFLDVPLDSRLLLQEWIRHTMAASQSAASEAVEREVPSDAPAPAKFAHPWVILAVAVVLGVTGGIWLATRQEPTAQKGGVSSPLAPDKRLPAPVSAAPGQDKKNGIITEVPPVKRTESHSTETASVPQAVAQQPSKAVIGPVPVQGRTGTGSPKSLPAKPLANQPGSPNLPIMLPSVQSMRFSNQPGLVRVEIDMGSSTLVRVGALHNPERIYFDLQDNHREQGVVRRLQEKRIGGGNDAVLAGVRVAPLRSGNVRVVLDLNRSCAYTHRILSGPVSVLIIELRESLTQSTAAPKTQ